ncbi:MAG: DUF4340 domain-containing protein [Gammaproteobacteria bacterium]|nr:DUF4340 domain-containing protein [Gammaproteobacteria bacterium]MXY51058.1 DUF4340 domain-containing protein [Gammaproteobacteria bacterium]
MNLKPTPAILGGLLAAQLLIVAVILAAQAGGVREPDPFLSFDANAADALEVSNQGGSVRLAREGEQWTLEGGLPADDSKVTEMLDKLADATGGWPVATSDATAERFEVTEDSHQRRIRVGAGDDDLADIFLGTSPGYRRVHARHAEGGDVYSIDFSNYEAGVKAGDWLERSLLRPQGTLSRIERTGEEGFTLTRTDDDVWEAGDATLDAEEVRTFVGRFTGLNVTSTFDGDLPEPVTARFQLTDDDGMQELTLYQQDDDYIATSDRIAGQFEVASYIAERMNVTLADLMPEPEEAAATDDAPEPTEE